MLKYAIIITSYNEKYYIMEQLAVFHRIWEKRKDFNVLVMDDGSSDGTADLEFPEFVKFYPHKHDGFGCAKMKNEGIKEGEKIAEYLLINDGDNILEDDILDVYDEHVKLEKDCLFFGPRLVKGSWRKKLGHIPPKRYEAFSGSNVCFKSGMMDFWAPNEWEYGLDDYFFAIACLEKGYWFKFIPEAVSYRKKNIAHEKIKQDQYDTIMQKEKNLEKRIRVFDKT